MDPSIAKPRRYHRVVEVGEHQGQHYFSMDYVEGTSLAALVRENPLPAKQAASIVKIQAEAIHYAHQKGILHRDLKPSNVLLQDEQPENAKSQSRQGAMKESKGGISKSQTDSSEKQPSSLRGFAPSRRCVNPSQVRVMPAGKKWR